MGHLEQAFCDNVPTQMFKGDCKKWDVSRRIFPREPLAIIGKMLAESDVASFSGFVSCLSEHIYTIRVHEILHQ